MRWFLYEIAKTEALFFLVWLGLFVPLENFSLIWRRHHCRWRAANFDLCSALMAIEQWWFFSVPHLLWHGASVYNGRDTHTYCWAFSSAWSCHYLFLRLRSVAAGIRTPNLPLARRSSSPLRHRRGPRPCVTAVNMSKFWSHKSAII